MIKITSIVVIFFLLAVSALLMRADNFISTSLTALALFARLVTAQNYSDFREQCLSFAPSEFIENITLQIVEYVPANTTLEFPDNDATCARPSQVVQKELCRVALHIATSNQSGIVYEHWLPSNWTGRLMGSGNGGIDGCIKYEDIEYGTEYGFSSYGANNGHNGTGGTAFYRNPGVVEDYAWRSLHTSTVTGKILTKAFYGSAQSKSYYLGCSLGGRQGFYALEKFPYDFDGVVAGSPALDFNNCISWRAHFFPITGSTTSPDFITTDMWTTLIHNEVLNQCDGIDGVLDGIIEDPTLCIFRPEALLCSGNSTSECLSPAQANIVNQVFSPYYGENGSLIYPAMQPGSEVMAVTKLYAGKPFSYSEDWFKYVVYEDPNWNASSYNIHDAAVADALNPDDIRTWTGNLTTYQDRGGKIITYHGGQDNQITSFNSIRYYNLVADTMNALPEELDTFYRFFRISGMFHCNSGPGAWSYGQGGLAAEGVPFDAKKNVLAAIVEWVENGVPPETMEGTKFVNDTPSLGVDFTRRHCRYPLKNTYISGNSSDPDNWHCL